MAEDIIGSIIFGFIRFVVSIVLAVCSIYFGVKAFDKLTEGIEEMEELEKGNAAVGLVIAAVILAIAAIARVGIFSFANGIQPHYSVPLIGILAAINLVKLLFGLAVAVISVFISFSLLDRLTAKMDEVAQLKKGNIAVAILVAGVLLSVALVVDSGLESFLNSSSLNSCSIAKSVSDNYLKIDVTGCVVDMQQSTQAADATANAGRQLPASPVGLR